MHCHFGIEVLQTSMPPSFLQRLVAGWLAILLALQYTAYAHMIDVPAGKKECFFEDLHKQDKASSTVVRHQPASEQLPDDCNVSSGGRRSSGH